MAKQATTVQTTAAGATSSRHDRTDGSGGLLTGVTLVKDGTDAEIDLSALIGATNETAAASDTATAGLNGLIKRLLQKLTTQLPAALAANGGLKVEGVAGGVAQPVSVTSLPLPTGAATESTLAALAGDLGDQADAAATGNGSLIAVLKQLRAILTDVWDDAGNQLRTSASLSGAAAYTPYRTFQTSAAVISALVNASARRVGYVHAFNVGAAPVYIRLYDKGSAAPLTSDTPVWSGVIPGNTSGAGIALPIPDGLLLANGLGIRVTAAIADADNTALSASEVMVNLGYRTS